MSRSVCVFTIASKNYLSQVRTLLSSIEKYHPEVAVYLVLCDKVDGYFDPSLEQFETILAQDLGIERFSEMAFKYTCVELNTAIKPFAIERFLRDFGFDRVIYFDPDIILYRRLHELFDLLDHHDVVLTPHITDFLPDDGCLPDNQRILQTGTNNLGFIGVRRSEQALTMLRWWKRQLYDRCCHAIEEGLFVDQKWMDLVPACVESSVLLRHQGYNVAYWNLASRHITHGDKGEYLVNGEPLAFFHFSGFNPGVPSTISQHDNRLSWSDIGKAGHALFRNYRKFLAANGFYQTTSWPYAYGCFDNGVPIPDCFRSFFRKHWAGRIGAETEVFGTSKDCATVHGLFQSPVKKRPLTAAAMALYEFHPDLQKAFPHVSGNNDFNYAGWFVHPGGGVTRLDETFIEPVRSLLKASPTGFELADTTSLRCGLRRIGSQAATGIIRFAGQRRSLVNMFSPRVRRKVANVLRRIACPQPVAPRVSQHEYLDTDPNALQPAVNFFGFLKKPTGVGEAARGMEACFETLQIPMKRIAFDEKHLFFGKPLPSTTEPDSKFAINYCHINADCTAALRHLFSYEPFVERLNIGFWAWELEQFPKMWDSAFDSYDEIWVPSTFVQQAVAARARIPVICIPHTITPPLFSCPDRTSFGIPPDRPAILCMFDTGSYSDRKNPLDAIRAVKRACASGHDPLLVIKVGRPELEDGLLEELRRVTKHIDCHIIEGWLSREQTWNLIGACDMFLSLHRSEGFGLILAEAMALGKPVIATGYSGNMDFMNPTNSFLVNYQLTTLNENVGPYPAGAQWAEPDVAHAADLICTVLENPERVKRVGHQAAVDVAKHLSVAAVSQRILNRLNRLGFTFTAPARSESQEVLTSPMLNNARETLTRKAA